MSARYNIAPSQVIPVILENAKQVDFLQWGFVPSWAKSEEGIPKGYINARIETVLEKPTFKKAFSQRRCLIPVSGYYEWAMLGKKKQPYFFQDKNNGIMAFAGIWSVWQGKQSIVQTCAILTTAAPVETQKIHERMPVIVPKSDHEAYLSADSDPLEIKNRFETFTTPLDFYPVSALVSNAKSEGKECIVRI